MGFIHARQGNHLDACMAFKSGIACFTEIGDKPEIIELERLKEVSKAEVSKAEMLKARQSLNIFSRKYILCLIPGLVLLSIYSVYKYSLTSFLPRFKTVYWWQYNARQCSLRTSYYTTTMNDPERDISTVVYRLTTANSPDIQKATIEKYMTSDVAFRHPVCQVNSGPNSRNQVLGIFQYVSRLP
jgi:hypothetical protein